MDWPLIKLGPLERKAAANRLEHGTADRLNERFFFPPPWCQNPKLVTFERKCPGFSRLSSC